MSPVRIVSVNVARANRRVEGDLAGIGRQPVAPPAGRVAVGPLGLDGEEPHDLSAHGGPSKAVYAYPSEHAAFWRTVRAQAGVAAWDAPVPPGLLGEHLTLDGITEDRAFIGDRLELPQCVLVVSEPRFPDTAFSHAMGFRQAATLMVQSGFCGFYLAVLEPGSVAAGDVGAWVPGPREVGIRELFKARAKAG